ncbi:MAG: acyltransferase [Syntrophorhabdaceae bacterium]|nr:acyltransferase [Syntrophorhabdaceae bacterium]
MFIKALGLSSINIYRLFVRIRAKAFSILISGAFHSFGRRSVIMPPLRISGEKRIGIGNGVFIGPDSWLLVMDGGHKDNVAIHIGDGVSAVGSLILSAVKSVTLEEDVLFAKNVYVSDHMHRYRETGIPVLSQGFDKIEPVLIKRGAWIGQNVVICPGVTIGEGSVIGANSVVTESVPDFSLAVGAPARVVKRFKNSV